MARVFLQRRKACPLVLSLSLWLGFAVHGHAQTVLYQEDFSAGCVSGTPARTVPPPLITHNVDGRTPATSVNYVTNAWVVREDFQNDVNNCVAFSTSWYSPAGAADDWLVLPPIMASAATQLSWRAKAYDPMYRDGYEVRLSTTGSAPADFSTVLQSLAEENSSWTPRQLSLAAYAGQTVRIAFRNNSNDKFLLVLDDLLAQDLVPGACGSAQGQPSIVAPSAGLCAAGTASAVVASAGRYDWSCTGSTVAACSADLGHGLVLGVQPAAAGSVSCSSNPVPHGGSTTCTPTANPGYVFDGWSGDCSGTACTLTGVTGARSVTAHFSAQQSHSFPTPAGAVGMALDGAWAIVSTHQTPAATALPSTNLYPYGQVGFQATGPAGGAVAVTLTFPSPIPTGAKLLKHTGSAWVEWPTTVVGTHGLRFTVTDAQDLASVGAATGDLNATGGVIDDPVVLAVPAAEAIAIPTLSAWVLAALSALVAVLGLGRLRRGRA